MKSTISMSSSSSNNVPAPGFSSNQTMPLIPLLREDMDPLSMSELEGAMQNFNIAKIPIRKEDLPVDGNDSDSSQNKDKRRTYSNTKLSSTNNKFFKVVEQLPPSDLLLKFSKTASPNVQEAVKSTIANLLGSMPQYALDAALLTTSSKLANLMFQMQMTGTNG